MIINHREFSRITARNRPIVPVPSQKKPQTAQVSLRSWKLQVSSDPQWITLQEVQEVLVVHLRRL